MEAGLSDGARAILPAKHSGGGGGNDNEFTMRVAPLDTALLMRRARRFRKFITYEAFKAEDTRRLARARQARAQARSRKESNDEQKRRSNDEAFTKWLSRVKSDRSRPEKRFEVGAMVRLLEPLQLTFEKESRQAKKELEKVTTKLQSAEDGSKEKKKFQEEEKRLRKGLINKRSRTAKPAELFTVHSVVDRMSPPVADQLPPSSSSLEVADADADAAGAAPSAPGAARSTALEVDAAQQQVRAWKSTKAVLYRVTTSDRWSVTIPGHTLVAAIIEEEEDALMFG